MYINMITCVSGTSCDGSGDSVSMELMETRYWANLPAPSYHSRSSLFSCWKGLQGWGGGGLGWKVLHHTYGAYHCQARWRCVTVTVAGLVDGGGGGYSFISLCKFPLQPKLHFTEVPDYILV